MFYRNQREIDIIFGDKIVTGLGDRLYLAAFELAEHEGPLLGAVQVERMLVVAVPDAILPY